MSTDSAIAPLAFEWPRVGEQLAKRDCAPLDAEALKRYADVSGDDNPLHLDLAIAQRAALEERPIHGMLMMGYCEPMLYDWRRDVVLIGLSAKFLRPVLAGQKFEMSGRVVQVNPDKKPSIVVRLMTHVLGGGKPGGDLAVLAEAHLQPFG